MPNEEISPEDIYNLALTICSREELKKMSRSKLSSLFKMIYVRLGEPFPPPTKLELEGLLEVAESLNPPAYERMWGHYAEDDPVAQAALKVCTPEELKAMPTKVKAAFFDLLAERVEASRWSVMPWEAEEIKQKALKT